MIFLHQQFGLQTGIWPPPQRIAMSIPSLTKSASRSEVATRTSISPWTRRNRNSLGISYLAANESIVLTLTIPEVCPVAAEVTAARCSRTSRISAAKDAPTGVSRTEWVARIISCTPR
jgi:hypothetical protein